MANAIAEASAKHAPPENHVFQYGTAGVRLHLPHCVH